MPPRSQSPPLRFPVLFVLVLCAASQRDLHHTFDLMKAQDSVGYAAISYCNASLLQSWGCGSQCRGVPPLTNVTVSQDDDTKGLAYIGYDAASATIVTSFRGTVLLDFQNWWSDLSSIQLVSTPLCPTKGCQVGAGFLLAYTKLKDRIFHGLSGLRAAYPDAKMSVAGHSLGASLAHLFVLDCFNHGIHIDVSTTVGSPRTGNVAFAHHYDSIPGTRWRMTHDQDPIPHLPPLSPLGFWHVSTEVFFPNQTGIQHEICTEGDGEDKNCILSVVPLPSTRDHVHYLGWNIGEYFCPP